MTSLQPISTEPTSVQLPVAVGAEDNALVDFSGELGQTKLACLADMKLFPLNMVEVQYLRHPTRCRADWTLTAIVHSNCSRKCPACVIARAARIGFAECMQQRDEFWKRVNARREEYDRTRYRVMFPGGEEVPF